MMSGSLTKRGSFRRRSVFDFRGRRRLGLAPQRGQHLAGLAAVVVDRLLAEDDQAGLLLLDQLEQRTCRGQRLHGAVGGDVDGAVRAHRQAVAQMRLGVGRGDGGHDHFGRHAFLAQAQRFLERDVVERIRRELHAVGDDAGTVRLHLDAHVVVDNALVGDQDLHSGVLENRRQAGKGRAV